MTDELEPYVRMRRCPKCGFYPASTVYRAGPHEKCRHPAVPEYRNTWTRMTLDAPSGASTAAEWEEHSAKWGDRFAEARRAVTEHFERECPNCHYQWAEAVVHHA